MLRKSAPWHVAAAQFAWPYPVPDQARALPAWSLIQDHTALTKKHDFMNADH